VAVLREPDEPHLAGRRPLRRLDDSLHVDFTLAQQLAHAPRRVVAAEQRDDADLCAERRQVGRHAPRAAEARVLALVVEDGHRRVRAEPLDVAVHVTVEHQVPDQRDARRRQPLDQFDQTRGHEGILAKT
jgi:hypothetical protein